MPFIQLHFYLLLGCFSNMRFEISFNYLLFFITSFIAFTVIGAISHEYGHIIIAKALGYETQLHYGSMTYNKYDHLNNRRIVELFNKNKEAVKKNIYFKDKKEFEKLINKLKKDSIFISLGGPIQTILTGTIGILLLLYRLKYKKLNFEKKDWFFVFISLFWLRQIFNPLISISRRFFRGYGNYFGRSDETKISEFFELPKGTLDIVLGVIGLLICSFVIVKLIPTKYKFTFILSGLIGGSLGFYLWMSLIGPIILP